MKNSTLFACLVMLSAGPLLAQGPVVEDMFPFVIPGLAAPAPGSITDVSWLNDPPAGGHGFVRAQGGHFVDGRGKRVRFVASNFTFGSCFPDHDTADKLAGRLASLGINCIRFHHTDNQTAPRGIWKAGTPKKNEFDPGQLDRLYYFIAALKRHGIYANINLHISRNYWEGEDFPDGLAGDRERQEKLPHYGKGIDKINDQMIRMQRDYARALLTHVNPYTRSSYAKEPCVAIVEINNENTLMDLKVASLPDYYRAGVLKKWNQWLKARHGSTEKLAAAWGGREELGTNLLPARCTTQGADDVTVADGDIGETRVSLRKSPEVSWHAQLHWSGLTLQEGRLYTLEFSARSELPRRLPLSTRFDKSDWHNCGLAEEAELGPQPKTLSYTFRAARVEPGAVRFDMVVGGGPVGDFWISNLKLRRGGSLGLKPGESLEAGNVEAPARTMGTPRGLAWARFLAETERKYTDGMRAFLKKDLGVEASIIDTQASYGAIAGTYRESFNDFVDMHAYWQHPRFPGRAWDSANWTIPNTPMVADQNGGNLARLGIYRVAGKPFTVSEYDHPAPSHYAAEMFPMIASFAALQDWDGFFQFDWGGTDPDAGRITGYFSLQQHPAKLAFLPAAALMFRRGDVEAARGSARLAIPAGQAEELTADNVSMSEAWKKAGVAASNILNRRLELHFTRGGKLEAELTKATASPVAWDMAAGLYTVDAPSAKAVVGRCTGKTTKLDGAEFDVKANPRDFAVLTLNAVDGQPLARSSRVLLVAAGNVENTGMGWNTNHTSVGTQWGRAPTLCEGIAARVTLTTGARKPKVHALDG
ncbi:MAG: beta-galactosidase, partial [Verrucomicrobia bacterium]|nr:beta-galactosidase [Verrucomicrobiota bacterium]